jgi:hypothetical protein
MSKKVKKQDDSVKVNIKKPEDRYPVFCFKYLQQYSYNNCSDSSFFIAFLERLKKLGGLGWYAINGSARHSFGTEKISVDVLKPRLFPPIVTEEVRELTVFRATGKNLPFLGLRLNDTFQVIFIETNFGDIYDHG